MVFDAAEHLFSDPGCASRACTITAAANGDCCQGNAADGRGSRRADDGMLHGDIGAETSEHRFRQQLITRRFSSSSVTGTRVTGLKASGSPAPVEVIGADTFKRIGEPRIERGRRVELGRKSFFSRRGQIAGAVLFKFPSRR